MVENDSAGTPPARCSKHPETTLVQDDQRPDGRAPREPIFGPGAAPFLAELIVSVVALGLLLIVLLLAHWVKENTSGLMFGGSQRSQLFGSVRQIDSEQRIQDPASGRIAIAIPSR